jgi:hypothetical protein
MCFVQNFDDSPECMQGSRLLLVMAISFSSSVARNLERGRRHQFILLAVA